MNPPVAIRWKQRFPGAAASAVVPQSKARCSVVVLNLNGGELTRRCVESVLKNAGATLAEILLVDNGSDDPCELEWANALPHLRLIRSDRNLGFAGGCNLGIAHAAPGNDIWLLNNDTLVFPGALDALYAAFRQKDVGAAGSISNHVRATQKIYPAIRSFDELDRYYQQTPGNTQSCIPEMRLSGFSMLIRNEALSDVGPLDPAFFPGGYEDDDFSLRLLEKGWRLVVCTGSVVYHHGSFTMERTSPVSETLLRNRKVLEDKWGVSEDDLFDHSRYYYLPVETKGPRSFLEIGAHGGSWLYSVINRHPGSSGTAIPRRPEIKRFMAPSIRCADDLLVLRGPYDVVFCTDLPKETYSQAFFSTLFGLLAEGGTVCCVGPTEEYLESLIPGKLPGYRLPALIPSVVEAGGRDAGFAVSAVYHFIKQKNGSDLTQAVQVNLVKGVG